MDRKLLDRAARYRLLIASLVAGIIVAAAWFAVRDGTIFNFHEYCPLSPVCIFFTMPAQGIVWPWGLFFFGTLLIAALFLRRFFCGWLCPVGIVQDILYLPRAFLEKRSEKKKGAPHPPAAGWRRLALFTRLTLLALTLFLPFVTGTMFFTRFCPMIRIGDALYRTDLIAALATLGTQVIIALLVERFFCRLVCPLGLILGWTGKLGAKIFPALTVHKSCKAGDNCGRCGDTCPMGIDLCAAPNTIDDAECTFCLTCVRTCRCYTLGTQGDRR